MSVLRKVRGLMAFFVVVAFLWCGVCFAQSGQATNAATATGVSGSDDVAAKVICNVVTFVQKLGLPIMTGVILGSSIMAMFGRLAWPAIVMLVVFTAIFFGAGKLIQKFAAGLDLQAESFECKDKGLTTLKS